MYIPHFYKSLFISIGCCLSVLLASGQQQMKVDSMLSVLGTHQTYKDSVLTARALLYAYFYRGDFVEAMKYGQMGLALSKRNQDKVEEANACNNLGAVYRNLEMDEKAQEILERSLVLHQELGDEKGLINTYNNLGAVAWEMLKYDESIAYFYKVLDAVKDSEAESYGADVIQNIALVSYDQEKYALADSMFERAVILLRASKNQGSQWSLASTLLNWSMACQKLNKYDTAEKHLTEAYEIASAIDAQELLIDYYDLLSDLQRKTGKYEEAIKNISTYQALKDSIFSHDKELEVARITEEFESVQKDQMNALLTRENKRLSLLRNLLIAGFVLISILSIILYRSLKHRQRAYELLNVQKQELTHAINAAEVATRAKTDFLSIMSHEIRTPLNGVIGLVNHLLAANPRADQLEDLATLRFSAKNLLELLNDILDFSRSEAEKIVLESVAFDLSMLADNLVRTHQSEAERKGIALTIDTSNAPSYVKGDPTRLGQVLNNLLSNAIKFTDKGSVKLEIVSGKTPDMVHFRVTDTGIGLSEEEQNIIFEEFSQASPDISRRYGGTGLGLAISKRLVHLMGSQIHLTSQAGKGSCFEFEVLLPIVSPPNQTLDTLNTQPSLEGLHVLLAEDNRINQIVVKKFLQRWGIHLDIVVNGKEALEKVQNHLYDLVLMDIHMPEMDGREATRLIRTLPSPAHAQTPIIALTASVLQLDNHWLTEAGLDGFVMKPFEPEDLRAAIEQFARG